MNVKSKRIKQHAPVVIPVAVRDFVANAFVTIETDLSYQHVFSLIQSNGPMTAVSRTFFRCIRKKIGNIVHGVHHHPFKTSEYLQSSTRKKYKKENHCFIDRSEQLNNVRLISHDNITVTEEGKIWQLGLS